jgi:dipeptidyl-peptidase-4
MRNFLLPPLCVAALAACARPADPPKAAPVDTSFLKRYAETRGFMLGRPAKPKITPDGKAVLFLRSEPTKAKQSLFEFDVATGQTRELLSPEALLKGAGENLSPEEKARRERQRVTVGGFANYQLDDTGKRVLLMLSGRVYVFDRGTGRARELKTGPGTIVDPKWSPNGKYVSYVRDHDVCAYDLSADAERAVTTGGTALKTHGLAEFVAQEEMGRFTGYWWSPDSTRIAYEEADHTGVEVWRIADPFRPGVKPREQFYPRPGKKNVSVRLGVVPIAGGETVWVDWDRGKYEYLAAVRWDKVGPLTAQVQDRKQQELTLLKVDPATGRSVELLRETDPAFLNINQDQPRWLPDDQGFLWLAFDESGLKWYAPNGRLKETYPNVNANGWTATRITAVSRDGKLVAMECGAFARTVPGVMRFPPDTKTDNPYNRFNMATGATVFDLDNRFLVTTNETNISMPRTTVMRLGDRDLRRVTVFDGVPPKGVLYDGIGAELIGELPSVAATPAIGTNQRFYRVDQFQTVRFLPRDFDKSKKYPVILSVYGGPRHNQVIPDQKRRWLVPQWLANQGFVVVAIDNRGTPGRGAEWERAIYQKFGTVPLEDQVKGLHLLCDKYPELDRERVGIVGWSFGGYMAANAVLRRPDVFRAAVAGAPVTDWEDYDTHYTERYLGLLPESQKAYDEASLIPLAKNLRRPLLLVHGTADDNVYFRHTLKLANALFRAGKSFEVLPLPGVTHMYTADPQVTERLWARTVAFFKTHLGEAK